jgi:hypothetical protein
VTYDRSMHDGSRPDPHPDSLPEPVTRHWLVLPVDPEAEPFIAWGTVEAEEYRRQPVVYRVEEYVRADAQRTDPISTILDAFAAKLTELNDRSVRLGGQALALQDPRDIALAVTFLAGMLLTWTEHDLDVDATVDALGANLVAYRLARARVDELRVDAGGDTA